jgi:hypothetical protein
MRHQKGDDVTFCMVLSGLESQFWYSKAAAARAATEELYFFLNDASNASCDSCITHIQPEHDRLFGEKINKSPDYSMFSPGQRHYFHQAYLTPFASKAILYELLPQNTAQGVLNASPTKNTGS